jgi:hypothetical protein
MFGLPPGITIRVNGSFAPQAAVPVKSVLTETKLGGSNHTIGYGCSRAGGARLRFSEIEPPLGQRYQLATTTHCR